MVYGGFGAVANIQLFTPEQQTCIKQTKSALIAGNLPAGAASTLALQKCVIGAAIQAPAPQIQQISTPMVEPSGGVPTLVWVGLGVVVLGGAAFFFLHKKKAA